MNTFRRVGVGVVTLAAVALSIQVVGHAAATLTTPSAMLVTYTLAPGATSSGFTPTSNQAVFVIGCNHNAADFSASSVTLIHIPGKEIRWVGVESPPSATVIQGASNVPGAHVVFLDYLHQVSIEVLSADELIIHNASTASQSGSVKLIW